MDKPFEIKIIKSNIAEEYIEKPFSLFINGKEIENVKRFCIDLDRGELLPAVSNGGSTATTLSDWTYLIEYLVDACDDLTVRGY